MTQHDVDQRYELLKGFTEDSNASALMRKAAKTKAKAMDLVELLDVAAANWAERGFCEWRHSLADPRDSLRQALSLACHAVEIIRPFVKKPAQQVFWYPPYLYLGLLLDNAIPPAFFDIIPAFTEWGRQAFPTTHFFDVAHVCAITGGSYPPGWSDYVEHIQALSGTELVVNTHILYHDLVLSLRAGDDRSSRNLCHSLCEHYLRRASDPFYSSSPPTEGADVDNEHSVDYRLAALVAVFSRLSVRRDPAMLGVHHWRWM